MPKISIKSKKKLIWYVCPLIFVVCLGIASLFSSFLIKTESASSSVSSPAFEIHLLTIGKSQVKQEAISSSVDYQKSNSGGYIWGQENYFYVISSAYLNKNDAVLVQNSLFETKSEILSIKFNSFSISGNFGNEESKILIKALSCPFEYYKEIYDIAVSLDTTVYNEISARMAVNNAHNNLASIIDNFELLFKENDDNVLKEVKSMLQKVKQTSQKLCGGILLNNTQTYSSLLKYRYTEILDCYYKFLN